MLSPKIFHTAYCLAPSLCYLAGLGKAEVPCISPCEFRKNTQSKTSENHSQTRVRIAAISHEWFESWSFQLKLLFTEVLPQDCNYRFCLVIKRVWILHQRKRKQLTQRCGVNLSHSLLDGIPVVCMDSGQKHEPLRYGEFWAHGGQESQCSTPPVPLGEGLEVREVRKACAPMGQLPSSQTSLCSENWLFSFLPPRHMEGYCSGNGNVGWGLRRCFWQDNGILGMPPILLPLNFSGLSLIFGPAPKTWTEFTFLDNPSNHWLWRTKPWSFLPQAASFLNPQRSLHF